MDYVYGTAADLIVLVHVTYVLVVVLGLPITWIGILFKQAWARNFWWRCGHLTMILIVVGEAWAGVTCPLTTWESQLRSWAHQDNVKGDFIARHVHAWMFYDFPKWVFALIYTAFGLLVLISFIVAPPFWPKRRENVGKA